MIGDQMVEGFLWCV